MDTYSDDLAELFEALDWKDAVMIGHSTGVLWIGNCGREWRTSSRVPPSEQGRMRNQNHGILRDFRRLQEAASMIIRPATTGHSRQRVRYSALFSSVALSLSVERP